MKIAIAGGGLFGCCIAIELAKSGYRVDLYEEHPDIMQEASRVNHNRIHLGYHYLRSMETAEQSIEGLLSFMFNFGNAVKCQFINYYAIAKHNSRTSPEEFVRFCDSVGISYDEDFPSPDLLDPTQLQACYRVPEPVFDYNRLKKIVSDYLSVNKINIFLKTPVTGFSKLHNNTYKVNTNQSANTYDVVINATYKNFNLLNGWLGITPATLLFQHVIIPRFLFDKEPFGLTVMDGEFCSVMPQGMSENEFLLYHVNASVIDSKLGEHRPEFIKQAGEYVQAVYDQSLLFMPFLRNVRQNGFQEVTRVLHQNPADARLTEIYTFSDHRNYFAVLSGKISTCYQLAIEIKHILQGKVTHKRFKI